jgi:hypothetical protein
LKSYSTSEEKAKIAAAFIELGEKYITLHNDTKQHRISRENALIQELEQNEASRMELLSENLDLKGNVRVFVRICKPD